MQLDSHISQAAVEVGEEKQVMRDPNGKQKRLSLGGKDKFFLITSSVTRHLSYNRSLNLVHESRIFNTCPTMHT
jgi:hypothetical protein